MTKLQDFKKEWKRIRELSELSLRKPLDEKKYKEMMRLAKKLNIGAGKIPRGL